jgi:hypothetical protein
MRFVGLLFGLGFERAPLKTDQYLSDLIMVRSSGMFQNLISTCDLS